MPGSGGSQPGVIVRSTCDFSGRAAVRVLGHRCSIVIYNNSDHRVFESKPLGSRFSLFECSITFSRQRFDYRRSCESTITVGWQPSALGNDTITVDYHSASFTVKTWTVISTITEYRREVCNVNHCYMFMEYQLTPKAWSLG